MIPKRIRGLALIGGVAVATLSVPSESKAIFHWFGGCCGWGAGRTTFMPTCNPCGVQTAQYVPQTAYRQEVINVPVTTYRPTTSCDPCTGMPVTVMRPVTALQQQVRMVPYTTYRIVYTQQPVATAPAATTYYPTTVGSSCCTPSGAATTYSAPMSYSAPAGYTAPSTSVAPSSPTYTTPGPSSTYAPSNGTSSYSGTTTSPSTSAPSLPSGSYPQQYESARPGNSGSTQPQQQTYDPQQYESARPGIEDDQQQNSHPLSPIPDEETDNGSTQPYNGNRNGGQTGPTSTPRIISPLDSRTTAHPVERAWSVARVSGPTALLRQASADEIPQRTSVSEASVPDWIHTQRAAPASQTSVDDGGWRPSQR